MSAFPINLMPERAKEAILAQAGLGNYPIESVGTAAMAIMSFATQGLANVRDPSQHERSVPLSQLYMILAGSGDAKSSVYGKLMAGVTRWQDAGREAFEAAMVEYGIDKSLHEKQVKLAGKQSNPKAFLQSLAATEPKRPRDRHNTGSKVTTNAIIKTLHEGWPTYGLFSDEGGSILGGHSLKAENSPLEFAAALTMLWDKGAADRATGELTVRLRGRRFAGLIMVQPTVARDFLQNKMFEDQGIHARFAITQPPKWQPIAEDHTDPAVLARRRKLGDRVHAFTDRIEELLNTRLPFVKGSDCELAPPTLEWSHEANVESVKLSNAWIAARDDRDNNYWRRFWEHVCRTAGVLTVFEGEDVVTLPILKAAHALAMYYADQWINLDLEVGTDRDRQDAPYVEKIMKALKNEGPLSERDITRKAMQRVDAAVRQRVLKSMIADERITASEVKNGTKTTLIYTVAE